ncbi:site-specific integrase [Alkalihalobacillus alcalophilus]|uniref:phage integrase SAM-like domain-containing protein n=1 Tax=Alkalihalobacillus alcalophilus TaxID=1445 RepID=UPI0010A626EE|nr:site-specific integrase [Alkalihalobacillus alcalophilus]MED1562364.1 site-specific integrase [Alkalihalobacillus alcalophilus]
MRKIKVGKSESSVVLVDSNFRIVPEVLDFSEQLKRKGCSINTVRSYLRDLKVFYEWLEIEDLKYFELKPEFIPRFIQYIDSKHLNNKGISSNSKSLFSYN